MTRLRAEDVQRRLQAGRGKDFLEVLARSIRVIEALGEDKPPPTLSDLSRATNLPKPSVRRILHTLCALGYADATGRTFNLTPKIMRLATSYLGRSGNVRVLQTTCDQISQQTGQSCLAGVLDGEDILVVAYTIPRQLMAPSLGVGARIPAFCAAAGRILLGNLPDIELDNYLERLDPVPQTEVTVTDKRTIRTKIVTTRADGFCWSEDEFTLGWKTIAYPLHRHDGSLFGALSLNAKKSAATGEADFNRFAQICATHATALGPLLV